jgi:hypothetical protein
VPLLSPLTTPPELIVALVVFDDAHAPPEPVTDSVTLPDSQTLAGPLIVPGTPGNGLTVKLRNAETLPQLFVTV